MDVINDGGFICFITCPEYDSENLCQIIPIYNVDIYVDDVEKILMLGNCNFEAIYEINRVDMAYFSIREYNTEDYFYKKDIISKFENIIRRTGVIRHTKLNKEEIEQFFQKLYKIYHKNNN